LGYSSDMAAYRAHITSYNNQLAVNEQKILTLDFVIGFGYFTVNI